MERMELAMIANLIARQSGEEVNPECIIHLPPNGGPNNQGDGQYEAYAARTENYTALVLIYLNGNVRVYVH